MKPKFVLKSKTVIGLILLVVSMVFGLSAEDQESIMVAVEQLAENIGADDVAEVKTALTAIVKEHNDQAVSNLVDTVTIRLEKILQAVGMIMILWARIRDGSELTMVPVPSTIPPHSSG